MTGAAGQGSGTAVMVQRFEGAFTQQEPIGEESIAEAVAVMRSGRLHRYNSEPGEVSATSALERAFADWQGAEYCLACASGGYATALALRAGGIGPDDAVLTNAFTLAPVPGAIAAVGARAVLVETTPDLVIDLDHLADRIDASGARLLLLSHMRGHVCDMDVLTSLLAERGVQLIEDCAHTMGASWDGRRSGGFGLAGCFSTQTYKHMNSGEGGLLVSNDAAFMARAILMSGSYMLYERHGAAPAPEVFEGLKLETPNMSGRMDNLRAAILLPQLAVLDANVVRWNRRYAVLAERLAATEGLHLPHRPAQEHFVGSSIQFTLEAADDGEAERFVAEAGALGVELKWFGAKEPVGFTSSHESWRYLAPQSLPRTDAVLARLFDMRIPLTFSLEDCAQIAEIIDYCAGRCRLNRRTICWGRYPS